MGVRESAAQQSEELNLHQMVVETEPKSELEDDFYIDLEKEILGQEWEQIKNDVRERLSEYSKEHGYYAFLSFENSTLLDIFANTKALNPDYTAKAFRDSNLELGLSHKKQGIGKEIERRFFYRDNLARRKMRPNEQCPFYGAIQDLASAKLLYPQMVDFFYTDKYKELRAAMQEKSDGLYQGNLREYVRYAKGLKILDPEGKHFCIICDEKVWEYQKNVCITTHSKALSARPGESSTDWRSFVKSLAEARIFFPERFEGVKKEICKSMEVEVNEILGEFHRFFRRREGTVNGEKLWLEAMVNLKIILAKEFRITENGFEFVMPSRQEKFQEKTPPRPERKQF